MSFSSPEGQDRVQGIIRGAVGGGGGGEAAPAAGAEPAGAPAHQSFGDKLGDYFKNRYPIAGGLANSVFGQSAPQQGAAVPLPQMPNAEQPDYSQLIAQNAKPPESSGLSAILKMLAGG